MEDEVKPNPYCRRSAISLPHEFFGRQNEMKEIYELIQQQQSIALIGERRAGKSSILNAIKFLRDDSKLADDVRFVFVNCLYAEGSPEQRFIKHMLNQISSELEIDKLAPDRDSLIDAAEAARRKGYKLVILMDEIDVIVDNSQIPKDLFSFFRAWSESFHIPFVISSREGKIEPLLSFTSVGSPFWNSLKTVYVGPFTCDETMNLIMTPAYLSGQPFTSEQIKWVHSRGGHYPFFIQIAASCVFSHHKLDSDRWHAAFMTEADQHLEYMLDFMDKKHSGALAAFLRGEPLSSRMQSELLFKGLLIDHDGVQRLFSAGLEDKLKARSNKPTAAASVKGMVENFRDFIQG
jgi:hypothetical protein